MSSTEPRRTDDFLRTHRSLVQMTTPPPKTIVCDVSELAGADLETVDALARLALVLRRSGHDLWLRHVSRELRELLAFAGLLGVLVVEPGGEAEEWEQVLGVEEHRELGDPAA